MRTLRPRTISTILALAMCGASSAAFSRDRTLQNACFTPQALSALAGERVIAKGDHRFDMKKLAPETQPETQPETPPAAAIAPEMRGAIRRVDLPAGDKLIALTFDLCEQRGEVAGYDGDLIDTLRRENVRATLFAGGKWMRSHQARTQQLMTDPLFEIANHSDTHRNMRKLEGAALLDEISAPQRTFEAIRTGLAATQCAAKAPEGLQSVAPRLGLFRFPFGACNPVAMNAVNDAGMLAIQWDNSTGDPDPNQSAEAIAHAMVQRTKPGSIIIAHANGRGWNTAAALPIAIPKLKAMGYTFVTVSELLARGKPVIEATCYDRKPGDTDRYDFLSGVKPAIPIGSDVHAAEAGGTAKQSRGPHSSYEPSHFNPFSTPF